MIPGWLYSRVPINGPVPNLTGLCFFHIPPRMALIDRRMIRKHQFENLRATWATELTEQVTHILVESHNPRSVMWCERLNIDLSAEAGTIPVLDVSWVVHSIADGHLHDIDLYRVCLSMSDPPQLQQKRSVQWPSPDDISRSDPTFLTQNRDGEPPTLFLARVPMWETLSLLKKPITFIRDGAMVTAGDVDRLEREGQEMIKRWREEIFSHSPNGASDQGATWRGEELKSALISVARSTDVKKGKWMLKDQRDLRGLWPRLVVAAADGLLGDSVTVELQNPDLRDYTFEASIYTRDFDDLDDVRRVLKSLRDLDVGLSKIYYKAHALDILGVYSRRSGHGQTRIYTSLFSSETIPDPVSE